MLKVVKVTYTLLAAGMILLGTTSAKAQTAAGGAIMEKEFHLFDFTLNAKRLEGGGISIQPCKWFSIHAVASSRAIYGGIGIDIISLATR